MLLALALGAIGLTLWVTWHLEGGAAAVNEAGRMRMQAWRLAQTLSAHEQDLLAPRLAGGAVRLLVLLTKSDKLTRSAAAQALQAAQAVLADSCPEHADVGVSLFSALKRVGVDEAAMLLHGWARPGAVLQTTT